MNKILILVYCSVNMIFLCGDGLSQTQDAGASGTYLRTGVGARALAMGGTYTAVSDDAYATYWNPAGLVQVDSSQFGSMYGVLSVDRTYSFLNYVGQFGKAYKGGISWIGFHIGNIEKRNEDGELIEMVDNAENVYYVSLARKINDYFFTGANIKYLANNLSEKRANGFGFDLSCLVKIGSILKCGIVLQDIGGYLKWNTDSNHKDYVPLNLRFGEAIELLDSKLLLACDVEKNRTQRLKKHFGIEYKVINILSLRAGYNNNSPTFGAGFKNMFFNKDFMIDYSYSFDKLDEGDGHRFSMLLKF